MNTKILFTDLDNTLLNRRKEITLGNAAAIDEALSKGHKIVINTGRPLCGCMQQIQELELNREGCYAIAYNGGVIYDCYTGKILHKKTIPLEVARHILRETKAQGLYCQTYTDQLLLSPCDGRELSYYRSIVPMPFSVDKDLEEHLTEEPVKLLAIDLDGRGKLDSYRQSMEAWAAGKVSMFYSSAYYLEHVASGTSKGDAILKLCSILSIPLEQTVACGDEENDIPMLQTAHTGAAMANASQLVKDVSDYVTELDCDNSGVAEIIYRFLL